jgi:predicted glycosyltransferase
MKIWLDFINTPQVSFFVPFIKDFRKSNHEIIITCRDSGNTVDLVKQHELEFHIVGKKVSKNILQKLLSFPVRIVKLHYFIKKHKPDVAASQSSFYQPIVARLQKIPCLYTNDNEHAKGNLFGFLFANKVVMPVALQNEDFTRKWPLKKKISFYPSVKEAIYLSQDPKLLPLIEGEKNRIYFRPEPWSAQYYKGPLNFFDSTLLELSNEFNVVVLPRDSNQIKHYSQSKFAVLGVAQKPLSLHSIISDCMLFIGAGGSMTRELAVLEIPVISIYQEEQLCVDKYLIDKGLLKVNPELTCKEIKAVLNSGLKFKKEWVSLNEGKESYSLIKEIIINNLKND